MMRIAIVILLLIAALCVLDKKWYVKNDKYYLTGTQTKLLQQLGESALAHGDIPVSALIMYNHELLATGRNDVTEHNNAAGHAELNAITNAFRQIGIDSFRKLDRAKLVLITTWQPRYMCSGAIIEYNIEHVVVIKTKSLTHWWHQWKKKEKYEWNMQTAFPDTLQDHLFKQHPDYLKQKKNL